MKNHPPSELRSVLEEEYKRLKDLSAIYRAKKNKLPKGYISIKKINGYKYAYLSFREKDKIRSIYIGKSSSDKAAEVRRQIESRKEYQSKLRLVNERIEELKRLLSRSKI